MADLSASATAGPSRRRYVRSNTASVTQLLSDSCNSILQRFRRNPSEKLDKRPSQYRFNELSTSASSSAIFARDRQSSSTATSDYGSLGSSSDSVHRPSYSSFNSTMSSYYKPLFRTFGKRFDSSPKRDTTEDKDKTPTVASARTPVPASRSKPSTSSSTTAESASSTITRLESKYCDILDRVHRRKEQDKDDKEKTLEPERTPTNFGSSRGFNALSKSATTANVGCRSTDSYASSSIGLKERTPYRLATQRSRNKFLESLEMDYYKKRAELSLAHSKPSTSSAADSLLYERNGRELSSSSKYVLKPRSKDSGYYESKPLSVAPSATALGKENIYKSKYDPDELLSELNSSSILSGATTSKTRRQIKPYKRSDTTGINFLQHSSAAAAAALPSDSDRKRENRRSGHFPHVQRSTTQGFFDADQISSDSDSDDTDDEATPPTNDPLQIERNHKRKQIESILQKYAPIEEKKHKDRSKVAAATAITTVNPMASELSPNTALHRIKSPSTHQRLNSSRFEAPSSSGRYHHYGSIVASGGGLQKSFTVSNVASHLNGSNNGLYNGNGSSIMAIHHQHHTGYSGGSSSSSRQQQLLQQQHQLLMRSSRSSRIPKALTTFVRFPPGGRTLVDVLQFVVPAYLRV